MDQAIPSPWGMPAFELLDLSCPASFFIDYENFNTITTPDFNGERVEAYVKLKDIASHTRYLVRAFPAARNDEEYFDQCPSSFNRDALKRFQTRCHSSEATKFMKYVNKFEELTVNRWNPKRKETTKSIHLGLVGIDESASKECGAITLDLLLRAGILVEGEDSSWVLADDWKERKIYLFGDAKTIENMAKFVRDMQDRRISYSAANVQSEIFLKALSRVMDLPGDWHTSLNMAQTIFNYCYVGFLDQFQEMLHWKNINLKVSKCYFQATRLITFVFEELMRFFSHQFISERKCTNDEDKSSDADYIARVAIEFQSYLRELKNSKDK